jgi:gluconokinase
MPDAKSPYVIALDVGTSSTRALLFDGNGRAIPDMVSQRTYTLKTSNEGEVSVDADMLVAVVAQTIDDVLQKAGDLSKEIRAVAIDTFWHSLLGVDEEGKPLTSVITWEDTRAFSAASELRQALNEKQVHERTGVRFHASYWPARLLYLQQRQPQVFACVKQWISFGEYFHRMLFGRSVCSISMASATGMLSRQTLQWDEELMQFLHVRGEQLPAIGDMRDSISGLLDEYAVRWPVLKDVPWFPALGDGASACIGSSCMNTQNWSLTMGTSSAIRVVISPEQLDTLPLGLWFYFVDRQRAVIGGAMSEGGNLMAWLDNTLKVASLKEMDPLIAALEPDSHGLTILPFISGERSVGWHAEARMTVSGLSIHTQPVEILRAGMEALAYRLAVIHEQLSTALQIKGSDHRLMASGGALFHSRILPQIIADTINVPIYPSLEQEASARGAALLALEALGVIPDLGAQEPAVGEPILPDKQKGVIYRQAALRQRDLYQRLLNDL